MDGVSAQQQLRAPRRPAVDPQRELFVWMCIEAFAVGMGFAGVTEAGDAEDHGWQLFFVTITGFVLVHYFAMAWTWARWWSERPQPRHTL